MVNLALTKLTSEQIFALEAAIDVYIAKLDDTKPSLQLRFWLQAGKADLREHRPDMALLSIVAGGVPADEARAIFALVVG